MGTMQGELQKLAEKQQFVEQCFQQKMAAKYGPNWQMMSSMAAKFVGKALWAACEQEWEDLGKTPQQKFVDDCVNQHMAAEFGPNWQVGLGIAQNLQSMSSGGQTSWLVQQHAKWLAHCQQMWADAQAKGIPLSALKGQLDKALGGSGKKPGAILPLVGGLIGALGLLVGGVIGFNLNTNATFPDTPIVPEGIAGMCPCATAEPTDDLIQAITATPTTAPNLSLPVNPVSACGDGVCDPASENSDLCPADCPCVDDGVCRAGEGSSCRDCGSAAGACGAPCSDSGQCAGGLACAGGVCWDACTCGGDCAPSGGDQGGGPACGPADGVCPAGCSARLDPDC